MSDNEFDVIFIGGGPGGYAGAIRAAQLGLKTMLIDDRKGDDGKPAPGGTCLNVGCIPSKALLDSSKHFHHIQHDYTAHGINTEGVSIDVDKMLERKRKVVKQLTGGLVQLFKANKIEFVNGLGKLFSERQVEVTPNDGDKYTLRPSTWCWLPARSRSRFPTWKSTTNTSSTTSGRWKFRRYRNASASSAPASSVSKWAASGVGSARKLSCSRRWTIFSRPSTVTWPRSPSANSRSRNSTFAWDARSAAPKLPTARSSSATTTARKITRKCSIACWWRSAARRRPTIWWPTTAASN